MSKITIKKSKDTIKKPYRNQKITGKRGEIIETNITDKWLILRICKEFLQFEGIKNKSQIEKWSKL